MTSTTSTKPVVSDTSSILVVDDNPDNLLIIKRVLSEYLPECRVITAPSAEAGLAVAAREPLDGALIDVQMPKMNGIEMCRCLKADPTTASIPLLLITAHSSTPQRRSRGLEAGADDFISRPVDNADLVARIKVMLRIKRAEDKLRELNLHLEELVDERTRAVKASEERFRQLTENIREVFWMTSPDATEMFYVSPAYERIWGRTCQSLYEEPKSYLDAVHPDDRDRVLAAQNERARDKCNLEYRILRQNDDIRWIHDRTFPVRDASGQVRRVAGIAEEITQRKQAEEALRREGTVNQALSELSQALISSKPEIVDIANITLQFARQLTNSEHGFVSVIDPETDDNVAVTLTEMMTRDDPIDDDRRVVFPIGHDGRYPKLLGHALNTRQAFYTNSPATHEASGGTPIGHVPLERIMAAPVVLADRLLGEVVLANAPRDYTNHDLDVVKRLTGLFAIALGRKQADARIHEQLDELQRWHNLMFDREGRVLELKREVNELLARFGEPCRYTSQMPDAEERLKPDSGRVPVASSQ